VEHERNSGFAAACAGGVSLARAEKVVIMHSDVVPAASGWLAEMAKAGDGPVGATLLYQDDSIQHAGCRADDDGRVHAIRKGLHRDLAASAATPRVDAASDACLMLGKGHFLEAGGFAGCFVSEFEDLDLCARLAATGYAPAIAPNVYLYHLEVQSRPKRLRELAAPYDAWLAARRLRERSRTSGGER
jgi:GT2 family glycosyltransferase